MTLTMGTVCMSIMMGRGMRGSWFRGLSRGRGSIGIGMGGCMQGSGMGMSGRARGLRFIGRRG